MSLNTNSKENFTINKKKSRAKVYLKHIQVTRSKHMTPRKQYLHQAIVDLKNTLSVVKKRHLNIKQRLKKADTFINKHNLMMSNLNDITQKFFKNQLKSQSVSPRGRRFTLDDKLFALSLYKSSAKAYRVMSKMFALPSRKTLTDLLQKIPLEPGINNQIVEHLKLIVNSFKNNLDKTCILLFDEISLAAGVQYSECEDKVIGVKDLGNNNRRQTFGDKADRKSVV